MTATTTTTTGTVTVTVAALDRALGVVIGFADADPAGLRHMLQVRAGGGYLTVAATDGHVAGRVRQPATGRIEQPFSLDRSHAELLHTAVRAHLAAQPDLPDWPVTLGVTDTYQQRRLTAAVGDAAFRFAAAGWPASALDVVFTPPNRRRPPADTPIGITGAQLTPFLEAAKQAPDEPMRWTFHGPADRAVATLGDWFTGALLPHRLPTPPRPGAHR